MIKLTRKIFVHKPVKLKYDYWWRHCNIYFVEGSKDLKKRNRYIKIVFFRYQVFLRIVLRNSIWRSERASVKMFNL